MQKMAESLIFEARVLKFRPVARALTGGCIFIYSGSSRLVSFEIKLISKEASRAEPEYMNIPPPPISVLATALLKFTRTKLYKTLLLVCSTYSIHLSY